MIAQDQRPLVEQLADMVTLANQAGMYDAADFVQGVLDRIASESAAARKRLGILDGAA